MDVSPPSEFDEYDGFSEDDDYDKSDWIGRRFAIDFRHAKFLFNYRAVKSSVDTDGYHPSLYTTELDGHFGTDKINIWRVATLTHELSDRARVEVKQSYFANYRDTFAEIGPTYYYDGKRHVTDRGTVNLDDSAYLSSALKIPD